MIILPAIDIQGGQCVRLYQGDFERVTIYDADPVQVAQRWQAAGARWLHDVDLDGAVAGRPVNVETAAQIRAATSLRIELGGGIRTLSHIKQVLELGVQRFIYTDIARDGALQGPNFNALREMQQAVSCALIASGGISSLEDLRLLAALGIEGTIVGKALYTGDVDLATAIRAIQDVEKR